MNKLHDPRIHAAILAIALVSGIGIGLFFEAGSFEDFSHLTSEYVLPLFFFAVGLELKHEFTHGYFSVRKNLAAPSIAAFFGVIVPAVFFVAVSGQTSGSWAIPTATDITLGIAVLSLVSAQASSRIRAKFLALATIDDVIGLVILLTVFSAQINLIKLIILIALIVAYVVAQKSPSTPVWLSMLIFYLAVVVEVGAGIQTSLIGFVFGFLARGKISMEKISAVNGLVVLPLFGFGIGAVSGGALASGIAIVVFVSILFRPLGKLLGILGGAFLAKMIFQTNDDLRSWVQVGLLGGLGLTVSLLIAQIAYAVDEHSLAAAVLGTLVASLLSAALFLLVTRLARPERLDAK